ncbi:hypothetical protein Theam_1755 (plasmid) [Thermovibrio ammonificans HB-1]|uniref:Uncharacterized protein n=1 Tax=Thermovibrio ammonificans (strain DSM 15698 / JCM 12110 / HB-1) TaxID=648996 RepID=E8T6Z0_THEA1|nr:TraU family protein [Thermovibrio ammonificans]ADU97711.1 hypothetical protein Theam_1755 [Thermovibrio ammonificans HB-1]
MRKLGAILLLLLLFFVSPARAGITDTDLKNWLDFNCIDFRIKGICVRHHHFHIQVGLRISYYLPVAVVEAPPNPYQTELAFLKPIMQLSKPLVDRLMESLLGQDYYEFGGNVCGVEDTYYREVHIVSFPGLANPVLQLIATCDRPPSLYFLWLSETDPIQWRFGVKDYISAVASIPAKINSLVNTLSSFSSSISSSSPSALFQSLKDRLRGLEQKLSSYKPEDFKELFKTLQQGADLLSKKIPDGGWGSKFPHTGYVHDISSTVAYHLMAVRALDYAFPLKPRWGVDKFQEVYPEQTGCYTLGSDRVKTEYGKLLKGETLVWIYWYRFECCLF